MDIILINLPWASTRYPSMGLSILKSVLDEHGFCSDIKYYNLFFSELIGNGNYENLTQDQNYSLGEQAFAHLLYPERITDKNFVEFIEKVSTVKGFLELVKTVELFIDIISDELIRLNPSVIGFTTTFYQKISAIALTRSLKKKGFEGKIIIGGAACEYPMGRALVKEFKEIDYIFEGASEYSLPKFLSALKTNSTHSFGKVINEDTFKSVSKLNSKNLYQEYVPNYKSYVDTIWELNLNGKYEYVLSYEASRGCWWGQKHHCTFCGLNGSQIAYRSKSGEKIINDLKEIYNIYGPTVIHFTDNIVPHDIYHTILPQLNSQKGQKYFMEVKSNLKNSDFIAMKKSEVLEIQPGIERLSNEALRLMDKGTNSLINVQTLKLGTEYGIKVAWNFLLGFAGETESALNEEIDLISKINHLQPPGAVAFLRLDRYSPNFERSKELGYKITGPSKAEKFMFYDVESICDIAYHFEYEFLNEPSNEVKLKWDELTKSITNWQNNFRPYQLISITKGEELIIQDRRNDREDELIISGESAKLLNDLNLISKKNTLSKKYNKLDFILQSLIDKDLIIRDNDKFLALPVNVECLS